MDLALHRLFPRKWVPLYTLIAHTTVPYGDALARARRQDRLLDTALAATATLAGATLAGLVVRSRGTRSPGGRKVT
ncbi:hypothetical protein K7G98_04095 [Saccharothrix sp. MB29]|nr:hypothetical protein [Saccharothrix sp. MB29]